MPCGIYDRSKAKKTGPKPKPKPKLIEEMSDRERLEEIRNLNMHVARTSVVPSERTAASKAARDAMADLAKLQDTSTGSEALRAESIAWVTECRRAVSPACIG